ncbi:MAG: response regulator transcription factor [Desulfuromonadaceae bacterium]|nr:response regulator transcription factor [Desulfuromonadaceae bacterium]
MLILLGSANSSVLGRWHTLLAEGNQLQQASTAAELKDRAATGVFDLIMLHRLMIGSSICSEIRRLAPSSKLFLLSDQPDNEEGLTFLKLGIVGYANTYVSPERLAEALHVIGSGGVWLGQKVIQQLILEAYLSEKETGEHDPDSRLAVLSPMENRVAELVSRALTNLEIAAELGIVERTVKAHLTTIYSKLHIGNRLSLALLLNRGGSSS